MHAIKVILTSAAALCLSLSTYAADVTVKVNKVNEKGVAEEIGTIKFSDTDKGMSLTPSLKGLTAGVHGFHIHQNPDCGAKEKDGKMTAALAAGGHYDPSKTEKHEGPHGKGHAGDLPGLDVAADGTASKMMAVPHLKVADILGRSVMIHEGGDNYSDQPKPLGGGGARVACGVIK